MDTEVVAAGNLQGTKIHVKLSSEMEQKMKSLLDSEKNPPRPGATSSRGPPPSPPVETLGSAQLEARLADKGLSIEGTEEQKQDRLLAFYTAQSALSPEEKTAIEELVRNIVGDYIFKKAWSNGGKLYVKGGYNLLMRPDGLIQIHSADLAAEGFPTIVYDGVRGNTFLKPGDIIVGPTTGDVPPPEQVEEVEEVEVEVEEDPAEPEEERWILPKLDSSVYLLMNNEKWVKRGEPNEVIIGRYHGSQRDKVDNTEVVTSMNESSGGRRQNVVRGGVLQNGNAIIPFTKMTMSEPKAGVFGTRRWADSWGSVTYQLKLDLEYYGELVHERHTRNPVVAYAGDPMRKIKLIIAFRGEDAEQQKAKFIADFKKLNESWGTIFVLGDGIDMTGGGKKSTRRSKKRRTKKRRNTKRRTKKRRTKKRRNTKRRRTT
jgi:hypothetical protein